MMSEFVFCEVKGCDCLGMKAWRVTCSPHDITASILAWAAAIALRAKSVFPSASPADDRLSAVEAISLSV